MFVDCFNTLPNVFHTLLCSFRRSARRGFTSIPDDILVDIFSRLPADCVFECRKVCKDWKAVISLRYFAEIQFRRATSVIYVHCDHFFERSHPTPIHLLVFDQKKRKLKRVYWKPRSVISSISFPHYLFSSFGGLFLFRDHDRDNYCTVCDTRYTGESRSIKFPTPIRHVCSIYFLPPASEYKILYGCTNEHYFVYDSKTMMWRRLVKFITPFHYSPAIVNFNMHWIIDVTSVKRHKINLCSHAILVFGMGTEGFSSMPHPKMNCDNVLHHRKMRLFVKGELLCLCNLRYYDVVDGKIDIWIMEDYENRVWVKQYQLSVGIFSKVRSRYFKVTFMEVNEDELLVNWFSMGLYLVNLTQGTAKELKDPCHVDRTSRRHIFASYTNSLHPSPN